MPQHVLITGGSHGIGLALARRCVARGDRVVVTGRANDKLAAAVAGVDGLAGWRSDVAVAADRVALAGRVADEFAAVDVVVLNAGVQRRVAHADEHAAWAERQAEIDTLLSGPVHLTQLLLPLLLAHGRPARIVVVTSGGAWVPQVFAPLYSACKAGLHSFTVTLRHALGRTAVRVVELVPPAVDTGLGGAGHGVDVDAFADGVFAAAFDGDRDVVGYGATAGIEGVDVGAAFVASAARAGVTVF